MESHQQTLRMRFTYRNATILICFFNLVTALLLLEGFLNVATSRKGLTDQTDQPDRAQLQYMIESEEIRRSMQPLELIKRVKEIEQEAYIETESVPKSVPKQTAAIDLSKRLNNFRAMNDAKNQKALEEWRLRKIERARQREIEKNGTSTSQA